MEWNAVAAPEPRDLTELLAHAEAPQTVRLPSAPLDVYAEAWAMAIVGADGDVTLLEERRGSVVPVALPKLVRTCRPFDLAFDRRGHACALTRCMMSSPCATAGGEGWTERAELHDVLGLSSARGAIAAWTASESLVTVDGGASVGKLGLGSRAGTGSVLAMLAEDPSEVVTVTTKGPVLSVTTRRAAGGEADGMLSLAPRAASAFTALVAGNGLVGTATMRGTSLDFAWANAPRESTHAIHTVDLDVAPAAVAAWDEDTLVFAAGRDLVVLDLLTREGAHEGRWGRFAGRIPGVTGIVGLGRVGGALVVVQGDGALLVYR